MIFKFLLAGILLHGTTGENLRARAYFDANNVKVGDPMTLTIDFLGKADFASLHPPTLSKAVDRKTWKIDDASAKTQTAKKTVSNFFDSREIPIARTITYRVRPLKEGVLWFPELEFEYAVAASGDARNGSAVSALNSGGPASCAEPHAARMRRCRTSAIPVHAVKGVEVVVAEMGEDEKSLPQPDALIGAEAEVRAANEELRNDENWFRWRKACAHPTADAFAAFGFPAAKMNEARCATLDGNWARALKIYSRLEWRTGQTPAIERGILAALAVKAQSREVELPVWRQVGRPLLRHAWAGRLGITLGAVAAVALFFLLVGRILRALACFALVFFALSAPAQGLFNFNFGGFGGFEKMEQTKPATVKVTIASDRAEPQVGENFRFLISLETPKDVTLENLSLQASETFGMRITGDVETLGRVTSKNASNTVVRLAVPVRYDVPFRGEISFVVGGMQSRTIRRRNFSSSSSVSFRSQSSPFALRVRPLPAAGQPSDFAGIVAEHLEYTETPDMTLVNSNDVVTVLCRIRHDGYLPPDYAPPGVAFEWRRGRDFVEWKKYFVADGLIAAPTAEIVYYDPSAKKYLRRRAAPFALRYRAP